MEYCLGDLSGPEGNAFVIMGKVRSWMNDCGFSNEQIDLYTKAAMSGDYENLVKVSMDTIKRLNMLNTYKNKVNESWLNYFLETDKRK